MCAEFRVCKNNVADYVGVVEKSKSSQDDLMTLFPEDVGGFVKAMSEFAPNLELSFNQIGLSVNEGDVKDLKTELDKYTTSSWLEMPISTTAYENASPVTRTLDTYFAYIEHAGKPVQLELIVVPELSTEDPNEQTYHERSAINCADQAVHYAFNVTSKDNFNIACDVADMAGGELLQTGEIAQNGFAASYAYFLFGDSVVELVYSSPEMTPFMLEVANIIF